MVMSARPERVIRLATQRGITPTPAGLAAAAGVSERTTRRLLHGEGIGGTSAWHVCRALGLTDAGELFEEDGSAQPGEVPRPAAQADRRDGPGARPGAGGGDRGEGGGAAAGERGAGGHGEAWHERRRKGIGASDIAGILGVSPWASPYSVWLDKVGGGSPADSGGGGSERMRWGLAFEDQILTEAARRLAVEVTGRQVALEHPAYPWARATLDGTFAEPGGDADAGAIEVKTTGEQRWAGVPVYYEAQVQWQLEVGDLPVGWVATLHAGQRLSLWVVERDKELGERLVSVAERFWERHVLAMVPPPIDGSAATSGAIAARYRSTVPELVADLSPVAGAVEELREVKRQMAELKAREAGLKNQIQACLGAAEAGAVGGVLAVTWRKHDHRSLDTERLRDEQPQIAERYTVSEPRRTLLLPGRDST